MKKTVHEIYVRHDDHAFAFYNEVVFDNELRDMGFFVKLLFSDESHFPNFNEDMNVDDFDTSMYHIEPIYATIHGDIAFHDKNTYVGYIGWDTGKVGYLVTDKSQVNLFEYERLKQYVLEKLTAFYNFSFFEVYVWEKEICDYCNAEHYVDIVDETDRLLGTELHTIVSHYKRIYNVVGDNVIDNSYLL